MHLQQAFTVSDGDAVITVAAPLTDTVYSWSVSFVTLMTNFQSSLYPSASFILLHLSSQTQLHSRVDEPD